MEDQLYKHDCDNCKYLGVYQNADLYCCPDSQEPFNLTLVARFSNDPPNSSSSCVSELEYFKEAKERAIKDGYLPIEKVKGETEMCETTMVGPVITNYRNDKHYHTNTNLVQYIKDKKTGRKLGIIQAFKIGHFWFNDMCTDTSFQKSKPFVVIVHSKVRPNCEDVFNIDKAYEICNRKCDFVINVLGGQKQRRRKYLSDMPIKLTLNYYEEMYKRARLYYKDCDEIVQYHEVFDYISLREHVEEMDQKIISRYEKLKNLVLEQKDNNFISITETFKPCEGNYDDCYGKE